MASLYEQLMASKGAPKVAAASNSTQLRKAPMSLRSAMRKYAEGGNVSNVYEDTGTNATAAAPDYSRAYDSLGGAESVNNMRNQFLGMGIDENTIGSIFSKYYTPEPQQGMSPQAMMPPEPTRPPEPRYEPETLRPEPRYEPETLRPDPRPEPGINPYDPRVEQEAEERRRQQESMDRQRADEDYYFKMRGGETPLPDPRSSLIDPEIYEPPPRVQYGAQAQTPPSNQLSGIILAGASWMAGDEKTKLAEEIFGQPVTNTAVGGQKTSDVLNQLNVFERDGGTFAPGSTVVLDVGANDIAQGVAEETIRSNLEEIISKLEASGVSVVLSGQPEANSYDEAITRTDLQMDDLYSDIAANHPNVTLVDAMSGMLNQKDLMDESRFHLKDNDAKLAYLRKFADAIKKPRQTQSPDPIADSTKLAEFLQSMENKS